MIDALDLPSLYNMQHKQNILFSRGEYDNQSLDNFDPSGIIL